MKSKSKRSAASKSKRTRSSRPTYVTQAQFEAWEATVKKHVPTFIQGANAMREFDSLLLCITGIPEGKRVMHVHHVGKSQEHTPVRVAIRKWKPRQSGTSTVDKTKFPAFDLRGPSYYITETSKVDAKGAASAWCDNKESFIITDNTFHTGAAKEGKEGVSAGVFAAKILARYYALCPTVKDPSKNADMVEHFTKWAISLQGFAQECDPGTQLVVRFARKPFTRATATRSKNFRVVVPAKTVTAKCKKYYVRANRSKDSMYAKVCPECVKEDCCLAVDVHDDQTVVDDAHVSHFLKCAQTDYLSRTV